MQRRMPKRKFGSYGWHPLFVIEWRWRRFGLGVELSLGDWSPAEIAIYFNLFGLLVGVGLEENFPEDAAPSKEETP